MTVNYPSDLDVLILANTTDNYEYYMYPIKNVSYEQEKNYFDLRIPGQSAEKTRLMGLSGMGGTIKLDMRIYNDGEDRANGTAPQDTVYFDDTDGDGTDDVITVTEQITYLKEYMHDPDLNTQFILIFENGNSYYGGLIQCVVEKIRPTLFSVGQEKWKECRMDLLVGKAPGTT